MHSFDTLIAAWASARVCVVPRTTCCSCVVKFGAKACKVIPSMQAGFQCHEEQLFTRSAPKQVGATHTNPH